MTARFTTLRQFVAFLLAAVTLLFAVWIVLPAPTYFFLTFSVGAVEVSAWLVVASLIALALVWPDARVRGAPRMATIAFNCAIASLALGLSPYVRFPLAVRNFDREMTGAFGRNLLSDAAGLDPRTMRAHPLIVSELFTGIKHDSVSVTRGIKIAAPGGVQLTADISRPAPEGIHPIVVQIYGGAWQRGSPASNEDYAQWLASQGYVVIAIDYRHAPAFHFPAQIDDIRTDLAWVRDHASEYGGDTSRVAFLGRSAGGHLATLAAYTDSPITPRAVVSLYGGIDLKNGYEHPPVPDPLNIPDVTLKFVGGTPEQLPELYRAGTIYTYVTRKLPPTLLIYGGRDNLVETKYPIELRDRLRATGTQVAYLEIPWANHAFDEVLNGPSDQVAMYYTERFLAWALGKY